MDTPAIHCHFLPIKMAVSILESMIWKKPALIMKSKQVLYLVGMRGFEPPTPSSRTKCATGLRYIPNEQAL